MEYTLTALGYVKGGYENRERTQDNQSDDGVIDIITPLLGIKVCIKDPTELMLKLLDAFHRFVRLWLR